MRFGMHVSIAGGFIKAVERAVELDCETFQIFAGNPRGWARKALTAAEAEGFRKALAESGRGPVIVHLSYLPNPAVLDDRLYERSVLALGEDFQRANLLGADYFVMHPGTSPQEDREQGLSRVKRALTAVLDKVEGPTMLLLENQGGRKSDIAADLEELAGLLADFQADRVGFCLDTCHAFVAGYDLRQGEGWAKLLDFVRGRIGLERLRVIHANDSKGDLGSGLDRHEHIGQGFLGESAFTAMGTRPELAGLPVILETPRKEPGDDVMNLKKIRTLTKGGS